MTKAKSKSHGAAKRTKRSAGSQQRRVMALGEEFKRYYRTWIKANGAIPAGEWMAGHIGWLNGEVANLKSRLRKLERHNDPSSGAA